ncbi:MAG: hypothetical protein ACOWWH_12360 [Eubacteriaceae bacterium]
MKIKRLVLYLIVIIITICAIKFQFDITNSSKNQIVQQEYTAEKAYTEWESEVNYLK